MPAGPARTLADPYAARSWRNNPAIHLRFRSKVARQQSSQKFETLTRESFFK